MCSSDLIRDKIDGKLSGEVGDGRYVTQHFHESFLEEPVKGLGLDLYKVGQFQIETGTGEGHSRVCSEFLLFYIDH